MSITNQGSVISEVHQTIILYSNGGRMT